MSKTYRHSVTSNFFGNGNRNHHNTLLREFKYSSNHGGTPIKDYRGLLAERDMQSDRLSSWRRIANEKRRQALKRLAQKMIEDELNEE